MGDPATWAALAGQLGGPLLGALGAPDPQFAETFAGENPDGTLFEHDPRRLANESRNLINSYMGALQDRAAQPVTLRSSYAQQPPTFTGGGLPMPIGVTGVDPALADPSLLSIPGLDFSKRAIGADAAPRGPTGPGPEPDVPTPGVDHPILSRNEWQTYGSGGGFGNLAPAERGRDLIAGGPDPMITGAGGDGGLDQARGAVDLLMRALEGI